MPSGKPRLNAAKPVRKGRAGPGFTEVFSSDWKLSLRWPHPPALLPPDSVAVRMGEGVGIASAFYLVLLGVGDGLPAHVTGTAAAPAQRGNTTSQEEATIGQALSHSLAKVLFRVTAPGDALPLTAALRT